MKEIIEPWEVVSKKAFWDRNVLLENWEAGIENAHRSYLPDFIQYMSAKEFIYFYGSKKFVQDWPRLRSLVRKTNPTLRLALLDTYWSFFAVKSPHLKPTEDFFFLTKRKRELYISIAQFCGENIYAKAKRLGMQYKLCFQYCKELQEEGKVILQTKNVNGRKTTLLFPA